METRHDNKNDLPEYKLELRGAITPLILDLLNCYFQDYALDLKNTCPIQFSKIIEIWILIRIIVQTI